jgi:hypothetical protein
VACMTARRSTGRDADRSAKNVSRTRGGRPRKISAAVQRVRAQVAAARFTGVLSTTERRALDRLLAALARLLGEAPPT